jgi:hypothetical protein
MIGSTLSHFRITDELGRGRMVEVASDDHRAGLEDVVRSNRLTA